MSSATSASPSIPPVPAREPGLSCGDIAARQARGEVNSAPPATGRTYWAIIRENVLNFINVVLFLLGAILVALQQWNDAAIAVFVVLVNVVLNVIQEIRAKKTLDRIAVLARPKVAVRRNGEDTQVDPSDIVRDDVLVLSAGDQIVVDGPLLTDGMVEVDESLLTGESDLVQKHKGDSLLSGSFCVTGSGLYRAEKIGNENFASQLTTKARSFRRTLTPVQREIHVIVRVTLLAAVLLEIVLLVGVPIQHLSLLETVRRSVVVAKLVPVGFFLSVALAYSIGSLRMARRGALIQQVNAIESLSEVDVLCLDKTGTLTTGRIALKETLPVHSDEASLRRMLGVYAASTTSGNRTIQAIAAACPATPVNVVDAIPFSSARKWSALSFDGSDMRGAYVLGAPEMLADRLKLAPDQTAQVRAWADQGLRVLVLAHAEGTALHDGSGETTLPDRLSPLGLAAFTDELRPHAQETLSGFAAAGVRLKVISGDNPHTVAALVKQAGFGDELEVVSGVDLREMDAAQKVQVAEAATVFGRITPEQKEDLVGLLKGRGHRVGMIGDGVNDVLSIKGADLGIAMESGSQAARAVADIVLLGDEFGILPDAVQEGQRIRNGMREILKLFMTLVISFALLLMATMILRGFPFTPREISVLTIIAVGIPTVVLVAWARPGVSPVGGITRSILHFVVPASILTAMAGIGVYAYVWLNAAHDALGQAQTALTIEAVVCGLLLLPFVLPPTQWWVGGDPVSGDWRPTLLAIGLFIFFLATLAIPRAASGLGYVTLEGRAYAIVALAAIVWALLLRTTWRYRLFERFLGVKLTPGA
jgi:cation-transporting ATPase E